MKTSRRGTSQRLEPEAELLLALARGTAAPAPHPGNATIRETRLLEMARLHGVTGLCHWNWKRLAGESTAADWPEIPPGALDAFRHGFLSNSLSNDALGGELAHLQAALDTRGVPAVFFKGPWLCFAAYPAPGARPVLDIDLGVQERDYAGAVETLIELGYAARTALPRTGAEALHRAHFGEQLRFHAKGRHVIELHFRLVNIGPPARDESWLWTGRRQMQVGSISISVPAPEAMLLHLLLHAHQHRFGVLRLLHDLRFTLEKVGDQVDQGELVARIRALRCSTSAYNGLLLARDLAGAPVPRSLLDRLRPGHWRQRLFSAVWRLPTARRLAVRPASHRTEAPLLYLLAMGTAREKWRYLAGIIREAGGPLGFLRSLGRGVE